MGKGSVGRSRYVSVMKEMKWLVMKLRGVVRCCAEDGDAAVSLLRVASLSQATCTCGAVRKAAPETLIVL
jgi:hypothetical protein